MSTEAVATETTAQPNPIEEANRVIDEADGENTEVKTEEVKTEAKPEKTPEQREIDRLRRAVDRKTRQREELRAELEQARRTPPKERVSDGDTVQLTRAQIQELVNAEAQRLAPTLREQAQELERRQNVVATLTKTWGKERFDEVASDLDDAFGGLANRDGSPKPAIEAVFAADEPAQVIEWLADPANSDEAERISKMSAAQAGRAIGKLEARLSSMPAKPQTSKAAAPLEPVRGGAPVAKSLADMSDDEFAKYRREQIRQRR